MIASGLLDFCRCCALRLGNNGQIKIIPFCVSSEERIMPRFIIVARLPTSACASRHAPCVPCWTAYIINCLAAFVPNNNHFVYNGMTTA